MAAYVDPTACIDPGAQIGDGTKVWHFSHVMPKAVIGRNCSLGQNVFVGNNVSIGDNVKIQNTAERQAPRVWGATGSGRNRMRGAPYVEGLMTNHDKPTRCALAHEMGITAFAPRNEVDDGQCANKV